MSTLTTDLRQGLHSGLAIKTPCRCATTAPITLSGLQTVDGVALATGDRVLVKDQSNGAENGIYDANTSTWSRSLDFNGQFDVASGTLVLVNNGAVHNDQWFTVTTADPITIGTTSITFGAGGASIATTADQVSFLQVGTGAVSRTVQSKLADIINVRDFGAVGDGVADDTAAIQNALASGVREVWIPGGTYKCTSTLTIPGRTMLSGAGRGVTILNFTSNSSVGLYCRADNFKIRDMRLVGPVAPVYGCSGIDTLNNGTSALAINFTLENLDVVGFYNNIQIDSSSNSFLHNIMVTNAVNYGIFGLSSQGKWTNVSALSSVADGFNFVATVAGSGGAAPEITNLETFANGGWGIITTIGLLLTNAFINNDTSGGVNVLGGATEAGYIIGGNIQFCGTNPFYGDLNTAPGISIDAAAGSLLVDSVCTFGNQGNDVDDSSGLLTMTNCHLVGAGQGGQAGSVYAIVLRTQGSLIHGNRLDNSLTVVGNFHTIVGNSITNNSTSVATVTFNGTIANGVFQNNLIRNNDAGGVAITSSTNVSLLRGSNFVTQGSITAGSSTLTASF